MLVEIQSESKLNKIFDVNRFDRSLLRAVIVRSFHRIALKFKQDCIQHNAHMNYLKVPLILKQALLMLIGDMKRICELAYRRNYGGSDVSAISSTVNALAAFTDDESIESRFCIPSTHLFDSQNLTKSLRTTMHTIVALMQCIEMLEQVCLVHIEAQFVEKFIKENILKSMHNELFIRYACVCAAFVNQRLVPTNDRYRNYLDVSNSGNENPATTAKILENSPSNGNNAPLTTNTVDAGTPTNISMITKNDAEVDETVAALKCIDAILSQKYFSTELTTIAARHIDKYSGRQQQQQEHEHEHQQHVDRQHMLALFLDAVHTTMAKYLASDVFYNKYMQSYQTIATCYCSVTGIPMTDATRRRTTDAAVSLASDTMGTLDHTTDNSCTSLCQKVIAIAKCIELCMDTLNNCMYENDRHVNVSDEAEKSMIDDKRYLVSAKVSQILLFRKNIPFLKGILFFLHSVRAA